MRSKLAIVLYVAFVECIAYSLAVTPAQAFMASSSTTGYVRTVSSAAVSAFQGAKAVAQAEAIAAAVAGTASGTSVALRIVAGASWPALGVLAGLTLLQIYLSGSQTDAIKAATGANTYTWPGVSLPSAIASVTVVGTQIQVRLTSPTNSCAITTLPVGWGLQFVSPGNCFPISLPGNTNPGPQLVSSTPATATHIASYLESLPSSDPNSLTSNLTAVGPQVSPTPATSVVSQPATTTDLPTTVVPASNVGPADVVVDPNAPKPASTTTVTGSQTTTTTTTTTTNPDGSTTKVEPETANVSCTSGNHEPRTFGSILQDHMTVWGGSGLVGALNLLKTLTWPSTPPTYTLTSSTWGTYTLDFSPWSGMLTAIRSIIIALASFVAYRIIFVGSK